MEKSYIDFFQFLSYRFTSENDLSDITWTMCESCESFREQFLKFFFPEIQIVKDVYIEREKPESNSRADFVIDNGGEKYLIENKINDQNHHFEQYDAAYCVEPDRFGYITNYKINDKDIKGKRYQLRTWEELYMIFSNNLPNDNEERIFWQGYLEYVKNVCGIIKIDKPMKLNGIYSLYSLMEIFKKKLTQREEEQFKLIWYNSNRLCGNGVSHGATGVNFEIVYKNLNQENAPRMWGWIGIYFNTEEPNIWMGFYNVEGWGKNYIDKLLPYKDRWTKQEEFEKPFEEEKCLWFEMSKELKTEFEKSEDVVKQENILKAFMDAVILYPSKFDR